MSIVLDRPYPHIHPANETSICEVQEMNSLKIFFSLWGRIVDLLSSPELPAPDPFDHPDISAMSLRDLADLPLPGLPLAQAVETKAEPHETVKLARCA
jgi:hypothetical protein